ncbi:hypothetical protein [Streptomyces sp. SBT349]|uniref:hypothetical protein n=1 Tax=Streptomyces sp. SBT349 TaxID=1580539 RepID=UPI00066BC8CB|nr:hypothetical protein [Streptomyces sp. SBT349]
MPELDDLLCTSEYPDPGNAGFIGHLCEDTAGHGDNHYAVTDLPGTTRTVRLTWTATEEPTR